MTNRTKWSIGAVALLVAGAAAVVALSERAVDVEVGDVVRGPMEETVDEEGQTRVRERYVVAAQVAGRLSRVNVVEGDTVTAGMLLARVAPSPEGTRVVAAARGRLGAAEAAMGQVAAQLDSARARARQAGRERDRLRSLADAGAVSQEALERAQLEATASDQQVAMAEATRRVAEADVAAARAELIGTDPDNTDRTGIGVMAPTSGRVLRVLQKSARVVQAGTPLVEIGDAGGLELVVDVLSEEAVRVEAGNLVRIEQWGGPQALRGRVRLVEPEAFTKVSTLGVEEQRVNVIVDVIDPPAALGAGYRVEARIVTWAADDVLLLPTSALFQVDGQWTTFAVREGRAVRTRPELGHMSSDMAEILSGLSAGDRVILYPSAEIDDGVPVK